METIPSLYSTSQKFFQENSIKPGKLMNLMMTPGCGGGIVGSGECPGQVCCSIHGWCGESSDYCGKSNCAKNCKFKTVAMEYKENHPELVSEKNGTCGGGDIGNGVCKNGNCCSKFGYCGFGIGFYNSNLEYCGAQDCLGGCNDISPNQYNGNHFWSNFEIADFSFFRSRQYTDYFTHLDLAGGFFMERWGDAPVHSLAVAAFLQPKQVHYFGGIF